MANRSSEFRGFPAEQGGSGRIVADEGLSILERILTQVESLKTTMMEHAQQLDTFAKEQEQIKQEIKMGLASSLPVNNPLHTHTPIAQNTSPPNTLTCSLTTASAGISSAKSNNPMEGWEKMVMTLASGQAMLPTLLDKPSFAGELSENPVQFIQKFNRYYEQLKGLPVNKLNLVVRCLREKAEEWAMLQENAWESFEQFEESFLEFFWGRSRQQQLRELLQNFRYEPGRSCSMTEYFVKQMGKLRTLDTFRTLESQIEQMMQQFPSTVYSAWVSHSDKTMQGTIKFLKNQEIVESIRERERRLSTQIPKTRIDAISSIWNKYGQCGHTKFYQATTYVTSK